MHLNYLPRIRINAQSDLIVSMMLFQESFWIVICLKRSAIKVLLGHSEVLTVCLGHFAPCLGHSAILIVCFGHSAILKYFIVTETHCDSSRAYIVSRSFFSTERRCCSAWQFVNYTVPLWNAVITKQTNMYIELFAFNI